MSRRLPQTIQSHPGVGINAMGDEVALLSIERICRAFGAKVEITDPFDLKDTKQTLQQMLKDPEGLKGAHHAQEMRFA